MPLLEPYLTTLASQRNATVPETSYYPALQTLLNEVGAGLRPRVNALVHLRNTGAGIPDLGLFDETQPTDQRPARGIVEAKPVADDVLATANGERIRCHLRRYSP